MQRPLSFAFQLAYGDVDFLVCRNTFVTSSLHAVLQRVC